MFHKEYKTVCNACLLHDTKFALRSYLVDLESSRKNSAQLITHTLLIMALSENEIRYLTNQLTHWHGK